MVCCLAEQLLSTFERANSDTRPENKLCTFCLSFLTAFILLVYQLYMEHIIVLLIIYLLFSVSIIISSLLLLSLFKSCKESIPFPLYWCACDKQNFDLDWQIESRETLTELMNRGNQGMARGRLLENTQRKCGRQTNVSKGEGETDRRKRVRIFLALWRLLAFQIQAGRQWTKEDSIYVGGKRQTKKKKNVIAKLRSALALPCSLVFSLCSLLSQLFRPLQAQCDIRLHISTTL